MSRQPSTGGGSAFGGLLVSLLVIGLTISAVEWVWATFGWWLVTIPSALVMVLVARGIWAYAGRAVDRSIERHEWWRS